MFDKIRKYRRNIIIEKTSIDDFFIDLTDICEEYEKLRESQRYDQTFLRKLDVVVEGSLRQFRFGDNQSFLNSKWAEAAVVVTDICDQIRDQTGLICSAGISVNKLLAEIVCKYDKPNTISMIVSKPAIARLFREWPFRACHGFGGKFGQEVEDSLKISTLMDLRGFRRKFLKRNFGETKGAFLWNVCRGIDLDYVEHKTRNNEEIIGRKRTYIRGFY